MSGPAKIAIGVVVGLLLLGALSDPDDEPTVDSASESTDTGAKDVDVAAADPTPSATTARRKNVALLYVTDQKDGDSFVASDGREYRLGLVNAPEANEPCGSAAARFTRDFLAAGFTVDAYSTDTYGRSVAEVFDASGDSLNVALAESGYGNDKYLEQFRYENPDLARRLEDAFAEADSPSCSAPAPVPLLQQPRTTPAPDNATSDCMSGYDPCLPIRGDMNCPDIGHPVTVAGSDPYGLDRDGDGIGCD